MAGPRLRHAGTLSKAFGGHGGFLPAEWGQGGDPDAFATRLREVLPAQPAAVDARQSSLGPEPAQPGGAI